MTESLGAVRFEYDEELKQFHVKLDEQLCKMRSSLVDSILSRAEETFKARKAQQEIHQYVIHASSLRQTWEALNRAEEPMLVSVLVGSGIPRLKGLRIAPPNEEGLARLVLPRDGALLASWRWQWIYCAIKMAFLQLKVSYAVSPVEVQFYLAKALAAVGGKEPLSFPLHPFDEHAASGHAHPWSVRLSPQGPWIELSVYSRKGLEDPQLVLEAGKRSTALLQTSASHTSQTILISMLQTQIESSLTGPPKLDLGFPLTFLAGYQLPILGIAEESRCIQEIFQRAKLSMQNDPRHERLFVCANLGLSAAVLPDLRQRLKTLIERLSLQRRTPNEGAQDYVLALSLFPFTQMSSPGSEHTPHLVQGSQTWLIWVLREMVKVPSFRLDVSWIASRLSIAVPKASIEQAIDLIVKRKMIVLDPKSGRYVQAVENLLTADELSGAAIARHYEELFELTPQALQQSSMDSSFMRMLHLRLTPREFKRLRTFVSRFSQDMLHLEDRVHVCEDIFHLGFHFFPSHSPAPSRKEKYKAS